MLPLVFNVLRKLWSEMFAPLKRSKACARICDLCVCFCQIYLKEWIEGQSLWLVRNQTSCLFPPQVQVWELRFLWDPHVKIHSDDPKVCWIVSNLCTVYERFHQNGNISHMPTLELYLHVMSIWGNLCQLNRQSLKQHSVLKCKKPT